MKKLVVGFTSIPPRFNTLKNTLDSLHSQTRRPDKIYLYIADYYERFNMRIGPSDIPSYLSKYDLLEIKTGKDYGPICKLFVSLQNETDPNTNIVTCDDDLIYGNSWLENLEKHALRLPDCAVGYRGRKLGHDLMYKNTTCITSNKLPIDTEIDIVTAVRGWSYSRSFFDSNFIAEWEKARSTHPFIFFNDDIWISGNLAKKNIKRIIFQNTPINSSNQHLTDALISSAGQGKKTNDHIKLFNKYWRKT